MNDCEIRHLEGLRADTSGATPKLVGRAIVTNALSEVIGGTFRERITPEAVRRAMDHSGDVVALRNHDTNHVLGRLSAKTLRLHADPDGLRFEIDIPESEWGLVESVSRGDVTGASFAFSDAVDEWDTRAAPPVRTITNMRIHEISAGVVWPAYPQTFTAALRSLERHQQSKEPTMPELTAPTATVTDPVPPVPPVVTDRSASDDTEVRVLGRGDSFRGWVEERSKHPKEYAHLRLGDVLRAMITGPRNELYVEHHAQAVRVASRICGHALAEDVVQDVVLYLLEKRDYLRDAPGRAYFLMAVKHGALRRLLYAWSRYVVAMDPGDLVIAEQMMARGMTSQNTVRLPVGVCRGCGSDVTPGNIDERYCGESLRAHVPGVPALRRRSFAKLFAAADLSSTLTIKKSQGIVPDVRTQVDGREIRSDLR